MDCNAVGDTCAYGRGVCDSSNVCQCDDGYVNVGDFLKENYCQVNFATSKTLWGVTVGIWGTVLIGALYALCRLERRSKEALMFEVGILCFEVFCSVCQIIVGSLEASASTPGARSIGLDPLTTGFFIVGNCVVWSLLIIHPISKAQTGVSSLALSRAKRARLFYIRCVRFFILMHAASYLITIATLYGDASYGFPVISAFFTLNGVMLLTIALVNVVALWMMHDDFSHALSSSVQELPPSQRATIEKVANSTKRLMVIPIVALLLFVPLMIAFAFSSLQMQVWIFLPIMMWTMGFWQIRYVLRSARASTYVRSKDGDKSSAPLRVTEEVETKNSSANGEKPFSDSNSSSLSSNGKSKSRKPRKTFRLKGIRSKPMQMMSQVTEGNSEGTVRFTEVDGVSQMQTSSSRQSRAFTLSAKLDKPQISPRAEHISLSSIQSTIYEVDIGKGGQDLGDDKV